MLQQTGIRASDLRLDINMLSITKFDIEKFDGNIWQVRMFIVLTHSGLKKALLGKKKKSKRMLDGDLNVLDKKP